MSEYELTNKLAKKLRKLEKHLSGEEFLRKYFWIEYNEVFKRAYQCGKEMVKDE